MLQSTDHGPSSMTLTWQQRVGHTVRDGESTVRLVSWSDRMRMCAEVWHPKSAISIAEPDGMIRTCSIKADVRLQRLTRGTSFSGWGKRSGGVQRGHQEALTGSQRCLVDLTSVEGLACGLRRSWRWELWSLVAPGALRCPVPISGCYINYYFHPCIPLSLTDREVASNVTLTKRLSTSSSHTSTLAQQPISPQCFPRTSRL